MASKFALDGLTIALAAEHSRDGILANCVALALQKQILHVLFW